MTKNVPPIGVTIPHFELFVRQRIYNEPENNTMPKTKDIKINFSLFLPISFEIKPTISSKRE